MHSQLAPADLIVFAFYFCAIVIYGRWLYKRHKKTSAVDYFLAKDALTWWAIGASIIASNISSEQFIGMTGSGFAVGLAISSYEWMSAPALVLVAVFFLPGYLSNRIYTMPQFLTLRYNKMVSTILAVFWLLVYVFVNLTSILYLGALAVEKISGIPFFLCVLGFGAFAVFITLGGMKVIGYTDVVQVAVLICGGLLTSWIVVNLVAHRFGGKGLWDGIMLAKVRAADHFHLIFDQSSPYYKDLPGVAVLWGGMWIANLNYYGCNQYITQRALGAASLSVARKGLLFAAFLTLLTPLFVVIPGIMAYVLYQDGMFRASMTDQGILKPDNAYSVLLNLLPAGIKGLSFAALTAAIVASLAGKVNSIATIFTLDIYHGFFKKSATEKELVRVGRITILIAFAIGICVAPALRSLEQGFQYIQEYTGFVSPGVFVIFLFGFFWNRTSELAALMVALLTFPVSIGLKLLAPEMPFLNRMGLSFLILSVILIIVSLFSGNKKKVIIQTKDFMPDKYFAIGCIVLLGIVAALYAAFW